MNSTRRVTNLWNLSTGLIQKYHKTLNSLFSLQYLVYALLSASLCAIVSPN